MISWFVQYHRYLVKKGEGTLEADLVFGARRIAIPWFAPIVGLAVWIIIFDPSDRLRGMVSLAVGIVAVFGTCYAVVTYYMAGLAADRSARKRVR